MMLRVMKKLPFNGHRWMSNTVMSFGDGTHGALGLPTSITGIDPHAYEPTPISALPPDVSSIAAGHHHSLAVTSQGHLWSWGRNVESQLGRGLHSPRETWFEPRRIDGLIGVQSAFASGAVSAAIGVDGALWVWGKSNRGQLGLGEGITEAVLPSRIKVLAKEEIIKVSFGRGHALALAKNGKLFGWGYSADGRLGKRGVGGASPHNSRANLSSSFDLEAAEKVVLETMDKEKDMPIIWEPCLIDELEGVEVADISCGFDHALVLLRDGTLLSGGNNLYGQLGRSTQDLELLPVDISAHAVSIASGLGHSLAICQIPSADGGRGISGIFSWGWSRDSQLGREGPANIPLLVDGLLGENLLSVSGGRVHSIALTSDGEVFAWGCGRNGRLGLGSSMDEPEPMLVELSEGTKALQAVSGFDHNLVLTG
ncbi:probable E3 ubiquitin-protein ligase HERC6 [Cynara cardunculus var. scolymus]|uniref:Regulator of chromosome condensation 1/beta-lactamase-inhibitor protein II n=1 Tax=Cynara cardunculus var. scolymus TaxID=59895 RepID=A0A103YK23_CYNCS|nr:probable E3 ubiquitin-protein ligase HERC6 [Cynara cardunculus var. scolymus]KVI10586.1 Regulator of chromosome condensation 1/beta-lactamase-inhibitor protein II [Cynara cardunculus var. scolymus]